MSQNWHNIAVKPGDRVILKSPGWSDECVIGENLPGITAISLESGACVSRIERNQNPYLCRDLFSGVGITEIEVWREGEQIKDSWSHIPVIKNMEFTLVSKGRENERYQVFCNEKVAVCMDIDDLIPLFRPGVKIPCTLGQLLAPLKAIKVLDVIDIKCP